MTILFAGGEDTSFSFTAGSNVSTTTTGRRTAYARESIFPDSNSGSADPPASRMVSPTFTASGLLWIHAQFYDTTSASVLNQQGLIVRSPDGVSRVVVRQTSTYGLLKVSSRNAAGTITDLVTASSVFTTATLTQFDLLVDYSATGGIQMWLNNVQVINYIGDPRTDSATQLNRVEFAHFGITRWSEVIVADQDTRGMALWTIPPVASGNTQSWLPNTVGNINEATINDATFVSTGTINTLSEWTVPTTPPSGTWNVAAVVQEARVLGGATLGPLHFDWVTRTGGVDYLAGAPVGPTTAFANYRRQWLTNPGTSAAWLIGDITAVGFNLGITSQT